MAFIVICKLSKNDVRVVLGADESVQNLVISKVHPYIDCSKITEKHEGDVWTILTSKYAQEIQKYLLKKSFTKRRWSPAAATCMTERKNHCDR